MTKLKITLSAAFIAALMVAGSAVAYAQDLGAAFQTNEPEHCNYEYPEGVTPVYSYEYLGSKKNLTFKPGQEAEVTLYIKNTGTAPLYSDDSGCKFRPPARLGTTRFHDRESVFYFNSAGTDTGWISPNRIKLDQNRLDPGEKGSFTFTIKVPYDSAEDVKAGIVYKEYFALVIEGKKWAENDFEVFFDVGEFIQENREYLDYIDSSRRVSQADLKAPKEIEVDISEQKMYLKVGDINVRTFPISTGTYRTPTPYGRTQILNKQEVRVSGGWPHYIMPKWMNFRANGYGIHALPSIQYDNGYYWREALSHIGTRRSHGCIRLLPADAQFAYDFTPVGTSVWVHE